MTLSRWLVSGCTLLLLSLGSAGAQLSLSFEKGSKKSHQNIQQVLTKSQYLKDLVLDVNKHLKFPRKLPIRFFSCQEENAFYDPERVEIQMCYELIDAYVKLEEKGLPVEEQMLNATVFTLLHELGHALIDQLKLPTTGREEDAVDQFATLALLAYEDEAGLLSGISQFLSDAELEADSDETDFADTHAFSLQRLYSMSCLVYGSNPKAYKNLAKDLELPQYRAEVCEDEYRHALYAWNTLLKPHLKDPKFPLL